MQQRLRLPFTALATGLFLIFSFRSVPSDSSIPDPLRQEAATLSLLTSPEPVLGSSRLGLRRGLQPGLRAMSLGDLDAALRSRPRRLAVFAERPGEAAQREFVERLPFGPAIQRAAERHRLDALLLAAVVQAESGFTADAVSPRGAVGLMQLLPSTGELYGAADLADPHANLEVGSRYLARLLDHFGGSLELALAAYNAGPAVVERYGAVPPFAETRAYVRRVMGLYRESHCRVWHPAGTVEPEPAGS